MMHPECKINTDPSFEQQELQIGTLIESLDTTCLITFVSEKLRDASPSTSLKVQPSRQMLDAKIRSIRALMKQISAQAPRKTSPCFERKALIKTRIVPIVGEINISLYLSNGLTHSLDSSIEPKDIPWPAMLSATLISSEPLSSSQRERVGCDLFWEMAHEGFEGLAA